MKILVVDDEKLLVKGIRFNLENEGYEVITGCDGMEAVELAGSENPDLIVLDLMMPRLDGLEACGKIREFSDVPIIMLTAKADDMDKLLGFEHGADDYLTKPFNILELKARIKALLRRSRAGQKQQAQQQSVQQQAAQPVSPAGNGAGAAAAAGSWTCSCGAVSSGKFCPECGASRPVEDSWTCSCGTENTGKFCSNCGSKKPEADTWTCSCGAQNTGAFCGNCGSKRP